VDYRCATTVSLKIYNISLIKQLAKHLILSQEWLIKRTVANETFVTNFPFIDKTRYFEKLSENDPVMHVTCLYWRHFLYEMDIWLKTGSCRKSKAGQCELGLCKLYVAICHAQISTCTSKKLPLKTTSDEILEITYMR
jgi:hypothetical protein